MRRFREAEKVNEYLLFASGKPYLHPAEILSRCLPFGLDLPSQVWIAVLTHLSVMGSEAAPRAPDGLEAAIVVPH